MSHDLLSNRARWMAAACAAAGFFLAGCDLKDAEDAARDTGAEVARQVAAAGEIKTNEELLKEVIAGKTTITEGEFKRFISAPRAEAELQAAIQKLAGALSGVENPGTKSALESQQGGMQLELSIVRFELAQEEIHVLARQAMALQALSQQAIDIGSRAGALEADAGQAATIVEQMKGAADKAAADVTARQGALTGAQAKVKEIQDQIASKDAQARRIYTETDAAFKAAGVLKGADAIAAGKKAMADRGAGDRLMEEIGNLSPGLLQAQAALELAQTSLKNAENQARATADAHKAAADSATKTAQRAKDIRAEAVKIVDGEEGVKARLATFVAAYAELDAKVKAALSSADQARSSYQQAAGNFNAAQSAAKEIVANRQLDSTDPIAKFSNDTRIKASLLWSQSAASQHGGRVCLAAAEAQTLADATVKLAVQAHVKAGQASTAAIASQTYLGDAGTRFEAASSAAASGNALPAPTSVRPGLDEIRWIGFGIEASARAGLYRTDNKAETLAQAKSLGTRAAQANPAIASQLTWLQELR